MAHAFSGHGSCRLTGFQLPNEFAPATHVCVGAVGWMSCVKNRNSNDRGVAMRSTKAVYALSLGFERLFARDVFLTVQA